jgi:hypothetical protein
MNIYTETRNNRKVYHFFRLRIAVKLRPSFWRVLWYRLQQKFRTAKTVCYACMSGNYDELENHYYINPQWDYICFTDNQNLLKHQYHGIWKIMPLQSQQENGTLNNRWHKFFPHKFLSDYESSVYIDTNVNVLTDKLKKTIEQREEPFLLPKHFRNNCIYQELKSIVEDGKDTFEHMEVLRQKYETEHMPHELGFAENNVIYRVHADETLHPLMEQWWQMLLDYSKRDQASLVYILWKNGKNINDYTFDNCRLDNLNFCVTDHKGK